MSDVVAVLDPGRRGDLIHVELVAGGIEEEGRERQQIEGVRAIARALVSCPAASATLPGGLGVHVFSEEGSFSISLQLGSVSVDVVIRAEEKALTESADWMVVNNRG